MAPSLEAIDDTSGVIIPDPLTVNHVQALRTKSGKLVAGVAAKADVELLKGHGRHGKKAGSTKSWEGKLIGHVHLNRHPANT